MDLPTTPPSPTSSDVLSKEKELGVAASQVTEVSYDPEKRSTYDSEPESDDSAVVRKAEDVAILVNHGYFLTLLKHTLSMYFLGSLDTRRPHLTCLHIPNDFPWRGLGCFRCCMYPFQAKCFTIDPKSSRFSARFIRSSLRCVGYLELGKGITDRRNRMRAFLNSLCLLFRTSLELQCTVGIPETQWHLDDKYCYLELLPSTGFWRYLNPGPFNIKEHTCIVIMSSTAATVATAMEIIAALGVFTPFLILLLYKVSYHLARPLLWCAS